MHPQIFLLHQDAHPAFLQSPFFPINSASFVYSLNFSIDFGSIVKHSYSLPPFSEINRCLVFPLIIPFSFTIYFFLLSCFFHFLLTSFVFFCVLCFGPLYLCSYISQDLFPNIFEYLCTHVFVVSQYFKITSSTSPLQFSFRLRLIIVSALIIIFTIVLHTMCTRIIRIHNHLKHRIFRIVPKPLF